MLKQFTLIFAVGGLLFAIAASLIGGVFKILLMGRFRMDASWYSYNTQAVRQELKTMKLTPAQRILRLAYLSAVYGATAGLTLGFIGFAWLFLA